MGCGHGPRATVHRGEHGTGDWSPAGEHQQATYHDESCVAEALCDPGGHLLRDLVRTARRTSQSCRTQSTSLNVTQCCLRQEQPDYQAPEPDRLTESRGCLYCQGAHPAEGHRSLGSASWTTFCSPMLAKDSAAGPRSLTAAAGTSTRPRSRPPQQRPHPWAFSGKAGSPPVALQHPPSHSEFKERTALTHFPTSCPPHLSGSGSRSVGCPGVY